jgi:hypothetical protein
MTPRLTNSSVSAKSGHVQFLKYDRFSSNPVDFTDKSIKTGDKNWNGSGPIIVECWTAPNIACF